MPNDKYTVSSLGDLLNRLAVYTGNKPKSLGQMGMELPPEMKSNRDLLLEKSLSQFLRPSVARFMVDNILGSSAARSFGTQAGITLGRALPLPVIPSLVGGTAGNLAVQSMQAISPQAFGELPESGSYLGTAIADTVASYLADKAVAGAIGAGKGVGKGIKAAVKAGAKAEWKPATIIAQMMGRNPFHKEVGNLLGSDLPKTTEGQLAKELFEEGFPVSIPEIQGSPVGIEFQLREDPGLLARQAAWLREKGKGILSTPIAGRAKTTLPIDADDETVIRYLKKNLKDEEFKFLFPTSLRPKTEVKTLKMPDGKRMITSRETGDVIGLPANAKKELDRYFNNEENLKQFIEVAGPSRAHTILINRWLRSGFNPQELGGTFDPGTIASHLYNNRRQFRLLAESIAEESKRATPNNPVKASDLMNAWNRFAAATEFAARGTSNKPRSLEQQAIQNVTAFMATVPTIGPASYPGVRGLAFVANIGILGPNLARAWSDPEMVNKFIKLQMAEAGTKAHETAFKSFLDTAISKGFPLVARTKTGTVVDMTYNPKTKTLEPGEVIETPAESQDDADVDARIMEFLKN